jgi:hypothetical protein
MVFRELGLDRVEALADFQPDVTESTRVDAKLRELPSAPEGSFFGSHCVSESNIPSRSERWRITTVQGRRTVKTSRNQMERQILQWH